MGLVNKKRIARMAYILLYALYLFSFWVFKESQIKVVEIGMMFYSFFIFIVTLPLPRKNEIHLSQKILLVASSILWTLIFLYSRYFGYDIGYLNIFGIAYISVLSMVILWDVLKYIHSVMGINTLIYDIFSVFLLSSLAMMPFFKKSMFSDIVDGNYVHLFYYLLILLAFSDSYVILKSVKLKSIDARIKGVMVSTGIGYLYLVITIYKMILSNEKTLSFATFPIVSFFAFLGFMLLDKREYRGGEHTRFKIRDFRENHAFALVSVLLLLPQYILLLNGLVEFWSIIPILCLFLVYVLGTKQAYESMNKDLLIELEKSESENMGKIIEMRTKELSRANTELYEIANMDMLTGLYNRKRFIEEIDNKIRSQIGFVIYYVDVEHFSVINDIHGYDTGDSVLSILGSRLKDDLGDDFLIARIGDDEFGIIMESTGEGVDASREVRYAQIIADSINEKVFHKDFSFELNASIGVVSYPMDAMNTKQLIKSSYLALMEAKKESGNRKIVFYNSRYGTRVERENIIEYHLNTINFDEEFRLVYQPQYDLVEGKVTGFEALLRWNSKVLGNVSPGEFIPIAERSGAIIRLGKWVIAKAFNQAKIWNEKRIDPFVICINLSPLQFDSFDLLPYIKMQIIKNSISPKCIEFEVTESANLMENTNMTDLLKELRNLGFTIAIDDFGTGYSSMSYIKHYSVNRIKIAKELVDTIVQNSHDRVIIKAIIMICNEMELDIIAEGCETEDQAKVLIKNGCNFIQGYYYSKPMEVEDVEKKYILNENLA